MLSPRLSDCVQCSSILPLLADIDCKLKETGDDLYNNIVFLLNRPVPATAINDLLNYKRILTYKLCNPDYARNFTVKQIASRVKILKYK